MTTSGPWTAQRRNDLLRPVYLVVDVSESMRHPHLELARQVVPAVVEVLQDPVDDRERWLFSLVAFADRPETVLPLVGATGLTEIPGISTAGGRSVFGGLFSYLRDVVADDMTRLFAERMRPCRPTVLLVSDCRPGDDWTGPFHELTEYDPVEKDGFSWYPQIVPLAVGTTDRRDVHRLTFPPFTAPSGIVRDLDDARTVLGEALRTARSARPLADRPDGRPTCRMPRSPDDFV